MKSGSLSSFQAAAQPEARLGGERDDDPRPKTTLIVAECDPDANELVFRVVCPVRGMSPLYSQARGSADGNPYAIYGSRAAEWCRVPSWSHLTLIVAQITSGSLKT